MADLGNTLLVLARNAIAHALGQATVAVNTDNPALQQTGATFVTLTEQGSLRGCIGSLEAWRPLLTDVQGNACSAAFRDPRFPAVSTAEFPLIKVEVSLLSPAQPMQFASEGDVLAQLRPNVDGVIFSAGRHRSTFLPQVWEQLPDPVEFMAHLKRKAGLPADYWAEDVRLARYTVDKWKEAKS